MARNVMDMFALDEKVAVVIGGARHLGNEMAEALAEARADVAITSRSAESAQASAKAMSDATGRRVCGYGLDATDETAVAKCFDQVIQQFGRVDILVNNAGGTVYTGGGFRFVDRKLDDFQATMDVNVTVMFLCARRAAEIMMEQNSGSIINIASMSGVVGRERSVYPESMRPNMQDYSLAKGGMIAFTKDLAAELGKYGIRVNAISPGGFERPDHPREFVERYSAQTMLGRMGKDGVDLKGAVVYLASQASGYVTGHNLIVDGGFCAW